MDYSKGEEKSSYSIMGLVFLIMIVFSLLLSYTFYLLSFSLIFIFTFGKMFIAFYLFSRTTEFLEIENKFFSILTGFISGLIIIVIPIYLDYIFLINSGNTVNSISGFLHYASLIYEYGYQYYATASSTNIVYYLLELGINIFLLLIFLPIMCSNVGSNLKIHRKVIVKNKKEHVSGTCPNCSKEFDTSAKIVDGYYFFRCNNCKTDLKVKKKGN
jgi:hypothetical protein